MRFLGFILIYSITWLIYLLPEKIRFLFSDLLFLVGYQLIRYRRKIVFENLRRAFPGRDPEEIRGIAKGYYRHMSDLILETAVSHFYSERQFMRRIRYLNIGLIQGLLEKGKQVVVITAHYGNWEYLSTLGRFLKCQSAAVYKPLENKYFDRMIRKSRERFNGELVPMEMIARRMLQWQREQVPALALFLADQRPVFQHIQYWTTFMELDTPLYLGPEKLARKVDAAVVYLKVMKVKRGRYEAEAELICEDPGKIEPHGITEAHVRILEGMIREAPQYWLWSHRRWKHSPEAFRK